MQPRNCTTCSRCCRLCVYIVKMNISVRDATLQDAKAIVQCLARAFELYQASYTPGAFADTILDADSLERRFASMSLLVAHTDEGTVIGTLCYVPSSLDEGHLRGMAVLPEFQGIGVAEMLLSRAESELKLKGCKFISLDTTAPLQRAIIFYQKHGYRRSGKVSDFFGMPLYEYVKYI
jgi:ribosomal protein S18 acetylase RimI-like enzyme